MLVNSIKDQPILLAPSGYGVLDWPFIVSVSSISSRSPTSLMSVSCQTLIHDQYSQAHSTSSDNSSS